MINPGSNLPSVVKLDIDFDPSKIQVSTASIVPNSLAFPTKLEGPILNNGKLGLSLSIGADTTKAIQKITKVGTITMTALNPTTDTPASIFFGSNTMVLSVGSSDYANENILATSTPVYINIASPTPTPTPVPPTETPTPTLIPSPTPTPVPPTETPTPTPLPLSTILSVTVFLHGIGASGDNANADSSLSNKSPIHSQIAATSFIYDSQDQLVSSASGDLNYDTAKGNFSGTINQGTAFQQGQYTIKIGTTTHLRRLVPGIQTINPGQTNSLSAISLVTGDVNNDNTLNILDYNLLIGCYSDLEPAKSCTDAEKNSTDLNDDGAVNQIDYNLFLRELSTQSGY